MQFCPECKSILKPEKKGKKTVLACSCGYSNEEAAEPIVEKRKKQEELHIVDQDEENLPTTQEECPECGHDTAYYWLQQTRAGDEPETKFLRCTECKHTWRDYS